MGSGRLSTIVRGSFIENVDEHLEKPTENLLNEHLDMSLADYIEFGKRLGFIPPGKEFHTDKEFFGDALPNGYFPPGSGIPEALRKVAILVSAYIQALRIALYKKPNPAPGEPLEPRPEPLPIVSYWITEHTRFEVCATLSRTHREVHVMILTPDPSHHTKTPPVQANLENMWAIATEERIQQIHNKMAEHYAPDDYFAIKGGAFGQKLLSY